MKQSFVLRSYRLPSETYDSLIDESSNSGLTVNSLLNLILRKHQEFDRLSRHIPVITMSKDLFRGILDMSNEEGLVGLAQRFGNSLTNRMLTFLGRSPDQENATLVIERLLGLYSGWFASERISNNSHYSLVIHHDMGDRWSLFLSNYFRAILDNFAKGSSNIVTEDDVMKLKIDRAPLPLKIAR